MKKLSPKNENNLMFESYVKHLKEHDHEPAMAAFLEDKSAFDLLDMLRDCCKETYAKVEEIVRENMGNEGKETWDDEMAASGDDYTETDSDHQAHIRSLNSTEDDASAMSSTM